MFDKIRDFFKRNNSQEGKKRHSIWFYIVCSVAVIIPAIFAIFYAYFYEDTSFLSSNSVTLVVYDEAGNTVFSDEVTSAEISTTPIFSTFYKLDAEKQLVDHPRGLAQQPTCAFSMKGRDIDVSYSCYFTATYEKSYLENSNGMYFTVTEDAFLQFLNSDFSESLYESATPPQLVSTDGEAITPMSVNWEYKRGDGKFIQAKKIKAEQTYKQYKISGAVNVSFSNPPSKTEAKLFNSSDNEIFSGDLEALGAIPFEKDTVLKVKIVATWEKDDASDCFGSQVYEFGVTIGAYADFSVSTSNANSGEFLILYVANVDDLQKVVYTPLRDYKDCYTTLPGAIYLSAEQESITLLYSTMPEFVSADGGRAAAVIPLDINLPTGIFAFSLTSGTKTQDFKINITSCPSESYSLFSGTELEVSLINSFDINKLRTIVTSINSPIQNTVLEDGAFLNPTDLGFTEGYKYNNQVKALARAEAFRAYGNEYIATHRGGQSVPVLNTGIVVRRGHHNVLGEYAVVEHGMGLRTWYCGFSEISVREGDIVKKGDTLGKCGSSLLLHDEGIFIMCTLNSSLINPNFIFGKTFFEAKSRIG